MKGVCENMEAIEAQAVNANGVDAISDKKQAENILDRIGKDHKALCKLLRNIIKENDKLLAKGKRGRGKAQADGTEKKPSGFSIPVPLTDACCDFLNEPHGTLKARTELTKIVIAYIKGNNIENHVLQDSDAPKYINLDDRLATLFKVGEDERRTTWFHLQKLMTVCYQKKRKLTDVSSEKTDDGDCNATAGVDAHPEESKPSVVIKKKLKKKTMVS